MEQLLGSQNDMATIRLKDVMTSASQITESLEESVGIDLKSMLAGFVGGKAAANNDQ